MKLDDAQLKEIEQKTKLSWTEKRMVKKILKQSKKAIKKYKTYVTLEADQRHMLEKELLSLTEVLEIETDEGEELTEITIKKYTEQELLETFEQAMDEIKTLL